MVKMVNGSSNQSKNGEKWDLNGNHLGGKW
jgi:hypothetical protein